MTRTAALKAERCETLADLAVAYQETQYVDILMKSGCYTAPSRARQFDPMDMSDDLAELKETPSGVNGYGLVGMCFGIDQWTWVILRRQLARDR